MVPVRVSPPHGGIRERAARTGLLYHLPVVLHSAVTCAYYVHTVLGTALGSRLKRPFSPNGNTSLCSHSISTCNAYTEIIVCTQVVASAPPRVSEINPEIVPTGISTEMAIYQMDHHRQEQV